MAEKPASRRFLGWSKEKGVLQGVAEHLAERYARGRELDLAQVIAVFPGRRAGRRFLEILLDTAEDRGLRLSPPRVATPGLLPDLLFAPRTPFTPAGPFLRRCAWIRALREARADEKEHLLPSALPEDDLHAWIRLADEVDRLARELGAGICRFGDVLKRAEKPLPQAVRARWKALAALRDRYLTLLGQAGRDDPRERLIDAVLSGKDAFHRDRPVILAGVADLTPLQKAVLKPAAARVEVLVPAPDGLADRFDPWGCVIPSKWRRPHVPLPEAHVHLVGGPEDTVEQVLYLLHRFGKKGFTADQVTVGVGEEALHPALERRLEAMGVPAHPAPGIPLSGTPPVKLLRAVSAFLEDRSFRAFAALVRHPDLAEPLGSGGGGEMSRLLARLDDLHRNCLPSKADLNDLSGAWDGRCRELLERTERLLAPLAGGGKRTPGAWAEAVLEFLRKVYGSLEAGDPGAGSPAERVKVRACLAVRDRLLEYREGEHSALAPPETGAAEAIRILLHDLEGGEGIPRDPEPGAVELLGWLELPLDDAPALVVTGLNEGFVPEPLPLHPDLPDGLRKCLDLPCNDARFARDAFFLEVLFQTRKELHVVGARRSVEGDSLAPSRLLFARKESRVRARLVRRLHEEAEVPLPFTVQGPLRPGKRTGFTVPRPGRAYDRTVIPVTAFALYLRSPFLFYLEQVLRLEAKDDAARELDPPSFGSLAHEVLADFGRGRARDSDDADEVRRALDEALERRTKRRFGPAPLPAVRIQQEQLRERFRAFAEWQAEWRSEGWRIECVERKFEEGDRVACPGKLPRPLYLAGRIDRIDRNEKTGEWALFDYKTGEKGKDPERVHCPDGEWRDLQLPLYRHLFRSVEPAAQEVRLGYIRLPGDPSAAGAAFAGWKKKELRSADAAAARVAKAILEGKFDDLGEFEPRDPVLRDLCGLGMLRPGAGGEEDR